VPSDWAPLHGVFEDYKQLSIAQCLAWLGDRGVYLLASLESLDPDIRSLLIECTRAAGQLLHKSLGGPVETKQKCDDLKLVLAKLEVVLPLYTGEKRGSTGLTGRRVVTSRLTKKSTGKRLFGFSVFAFHFLRDFWVLSINRMSTIENKFY
jgi:hypothetical protein